MKPTMVERAPTSAVGRGGYQSEADGRGVSVASLYSQSIQPRAKAEQWARKRLTRE
jgi:hypothetical protein